MTAANLLFNPTFPQHADSWTAAKSVSTQPAAPKPAAPATGPRTPQGKAVSARNATSHGLFARDVVLPSLGEDPEGYRQLEAEWTAQLQPRSLLERHYVEKIAAASWRLRRLHRWQAQLFENETLTEGERLDRLDKVLRHETALHRQIDTSVKMLNKDVPQLTKGRARDRALVDTMQTELDCRDDRESALEVEFEAREQLKKMEEDAAASPVDYARLDTAQDCQNEPAPRAVADPPGGRPFSERDSSPRSAPCGACCTDAAENCQNEPPATPPAPTDFGIMGLTYDGRVITSQDAKGKTPTRRVF